jgi:hypothetical protein
MAIFATAYVFFRLEINFKRFFCFVLPVVCTRIFDADISVVIQKYGIHKSSI